MKTAKVTVALRFPDNYTVGQINDILSDCDYTFNYPVKEGETDVHEIDSEIIDIQIK